MAASPRVRRRASGQPAPHVGVDVGASLAKLASRVPGADRAEYHLLPAYDLPAIAAELASLDPATLGVTGAGAAPLCDHIGRHDDRTPQRFDEFEAWSGGARRLLEWSELEVSGPFLLVSLGTGTSILHVDGERVARVGGTALGGGTLLGLAKALIEEPDFDGLCTLARDGMEHRGEVDLLVGDIYRPGEIALPPGLNAASFAKLARPGGPDAAHPASRQAIAAAAMAMVGENVAWIAAWRAASLGVEDVIFAGSTLRHNPVMEAVLLAVCVGAGRRGHVLRVGEFAGALGALELAA